MSLRVRAGRARRGLVPAIGLIALAGCATVGGGAPQAGITPLAAFDAPIAAELEAREAARRALLAPGGRCLAADRTLSGRVAVRNGQEGGSGRLDWRQSGGTLAVELSAPVTRQGWRLTVDAGGARLEGAEGGLRTGPDATALLREVTGWQVPIEALACWLVGVPADPGQAGPAELGFRAGGGTPPVLARIRQDGWEILLDGWSPEGVPARLTAQRRDVSLRLVVDSRAGGAR